MKHFDIFQHEQKITIQSTREGRCLQYTREMIQRKHSSPVLFVYIALTLEQGLFSINEY